MKICRQLFCIEFKSSSQKHLIGSAHLVFLQELPSLLASMHRMCHQVDMTSDARVAEVNNLKLCIISCLALEILKDFSGRPRVRRRHGLPQKKVILELLSGRRPHSHEQKEETSKHQLDCECTFRFPESVPTFPGCGLGLNFPGAAAAAFFHL